MSFKREVLTKLDELSKKQIEHTVELAKNTIVLTEHHVRASNLEARFRPVEHHVLFLNKLYKVLGSFIATVAALAAVYHYLVK